ncbi:hypothetical protein IV203_009488 [Nitzschia inconspicua]|uniref:Uncharacterized protein n=1 Tax=Nitzschia inconspicua TaxID=303405 RepID=A0A9K3PK34_9STRA|nr:hypothetical protein IV203_009488 [Nitzschia inconspicua]
MNTSRCGIAMVPWKKSFATFVPAAFLHHPRFVVLHYVINLGIVLTQTFPPAVLFLGLPKPTLHVLVRATMFPLRPDRPTGATNQDYTDTVSAYDEHISVQLILKQQILTTVEPTGVCSPKSWMIKSTATPMLHPCSSHHHREESRGQHRQEAEFLLEPRRRAPQHYVGPHHLMDGPR